MIAVCVGGCRLMWFCRCLLIALLLLVSVGIDDSIDEAINTRVLLPPLIEPSKPLSAIADFNSEASHTPAPEAPKEVIKPLDLSLPKINVIDSDQMLDGRLVKLPDLFVDDDNSDSAVSYRAIPHFKETEKLLQKPEIDGATVGIDVKIR